MHDVVLEARLLPPRLLQWRERTGGARRVLRQQALFATVRAVAALVVLLEQAGECSGGRGRRWAEVGSAGDEQPARRALDVFGGRYSRLLFAYGPVLDNRGAKFVGSRTSLALRYVNCLRFIIVDGSSPSGHGFTITFDMALRVCVHVYVCVCVHVYV